MNRLRNLRYIVAMLMATIWVSAIPGASAATGTTRWVDADAGGSGGPAECATAGYTTIQSAIDAANPNDFIFVCPGDYAEQLTIDEKVLVRARPLLQAAIVAPAVVTPGLDGMTALIRLTHDNARLRGFKIAVPAGGAELIETFVPPACTHLDAAILVLGQNDVVKNNHIRAVGDLSLSGSCGYDYGIVVGSHDSGEGVPVVPDPISATANVTFNWVKDFKVGGILVEESDSYAYVRRNTIRWEHVNDPCNGASSGPIIVVPTIDVGCVIIIDTFGPNSAFASTFGIGVESTARADILRNTVTSGPNSCYEPSYICAPGTTGTIDNGIILTGLDGTETTNVMYNITWKMLGGIVTQTGADGAVIAHNYVHNTHYGYQITHGTDLELYDNRAVNNNFGTSVNAGGNDFHDNDFRGNITTDCWDLTTGSGTESTNNTWTNNQGNTNDPEALCTPDGG